MVKKKKQKEKKSPLEKVTGAEVQGWKHKSKEVYDHVSTDSDAAEADKVTEVYI